MKRIPWFEKGEEFEDWFELVASPMVVAQGGTIERTVKFSEPDLRGIDFYITDPNGKVTNLDLCLDIQSKFDRTYKDTTAVASPAMVRTMLAEDGSNMWEFLRNCTYAWNQLGVM